MKKFLLILNFILIYSFAYPFEGNIFAIVENDTVTIWDTAAFRNCGALYDMQVVLEYNHITVYEVDTGAYAYCMCYFDLSVTITSLESGYYTVDVKTVSLENDTIYQGSTSFSIGNNPGGNFIVSQYQSECYNIVDVDEYLPEKNNKVLYQNFPNPFSEKTTIKFYVPQNVTAELSVYNLVGQAVKVYPVFQSGLHTVEWDGKNEQETDLEGGIYFYQLKSEKDVLIKKMVLVR